jgi:uncharacterized coiled-coil DUF342 family protein
MTQTTVTYTLEEVLKRFEGKIDDLKQDIKEIKQDIKEIKQDIGEIKTDIAKLSEKLDGIDKRVSKLEGTQTTQLWALIVLLVGAFLKFGFFPNP